MIRALLGAALLLASSGLVSTIRADDVHRGAGQPMNTQVIGSVRLNQGSTLLREWVIVNDPALPVSLSPQNFNGVYPTYSERDRAYQYYSRMIAQVEEPVVAISVTHIVFDVWNQRVRTLRLDRIADLTVGTHTVEGRWRIDSEPQAEAHFSSISFISRVRLANGEVRSADLGLIVAEAQRISAGISEADLAARD